MIRINLLDRTVNRLNGCIFMERGKFKLVSHFLKFGLYLWFVYLSLPFISNVCFQNLFINDFLGKASCPWLIISDCHSLLSLKYLTYSSNLISDCQVTVVMFESLSFICEFSFILEIQSFTCHGVQVFSRKFGMVYTGCVIFW